ncbi:MAG: alpha/beta hydrolase [Beijerinckiaceae bacterium]|nr:alpha/beta hydrolase [Beijerinckiaceae bacterium]
MSGVMESLVEIPGTQLYLRDTGGDGPPLMLLHPASGSAMIWEFQEQALRASGFRVLAWSRRGYWKSQAYDKANAGVGSQDLLHLADALGLDAFHLVGSAAGGSIAMDFALSNPARLRSLIIANNSAGVREGPIAEAAERIRPAGWAQMPVEFRELGPSYRAVDPVGAQRWLDLEHASLVGAEYRQKLANGVTEAALAGMQVPTLLITGDADLIAPPSIIRMLAAILPRSEICIAPEAGHSVYWEQPGFFNDAVARFARRHG